MEKNRQRIIEYLNNVVIARGWDQRPQCFDDIGTRRPGQLSKLYPRCRNPGLIVVILDSHPSGLWSHRLCCVQHAKINAIFIEKVRLTLYQIAEGRKTFLARKAAEALAAP